jgi:uncharacterized protein YkwD
MSANAFIGHESPRTGEPKQRVERAGLAPLLLLETIARGADEQALADSAADRAGEGRNLLARAITHVGIGIATVPDGHGSTLVATELFAQLTPSADLAAATPRLLSLVNEARVQRGAQPVPLDPGLSEVAHQAAQRFIGQADATEQSVLDATDRELGKFSLVYRRVNALLSVTEHLEDAATLEPALDSQAGGLGIGIAKGHRPDRGAALAIVMIVGIRR